MTSVALKASQLQLVKALRDRHARSAPSALLVMATVVRSEPYCSITTELASIWQRSARRAISRASGRALMLLRCCQCRR